MQFGESNDVHVLAFDLYLLASFDSSQLHFRSDMAAIILGQRILSLFASKTLLLPPRLEGHLQQYLGRVFVPSWCRKILQGHL